MSPFPPQESSKATTMRVLVLLLLSLLLLFLESAIAIGQFCGTNAGCIYPMPSSVVQTPSGIPPTISPANFSVSCIPECHQGCQNIVVPALARVFKRVFRRIGHVQVSETTKITSVVVTLSSLSATPLQHGVNESYSLSLPAAGPSMAGLPPHWHPHPLTLAFICTFNLTLTLTPTPTLICSVHRRRLGVGSTESTRNIRSGNHAASWDRSRLLQHIHPCVFCYNLATCPDS